MFLGALINFLQKKLINKVLNSCLSKIKTYLFPMATHVFKKLAASYVPSTINFNEYLNRCSVVEQNKGRILLTSVPENPISPSFGNGFVGTAFEAYSHHRHLVLRPDDVWIAIMVPFAQYVDANAEKMRSQFVSHEGKIQLTAFGSGSITSCDWSSLLKQLCDKVGTYTKDEIKAWVEPDFSTTTDKDRFVGRIMLMSAMKNYFSYKCCLECGLPAVTLEGTLADWQKIRAKVDKLKIYGEVMVKWHSVLAPILDQFVATFSGKPDVDFWQRICHYEGGGSGPRYLSGWILAFVPFIERYGRKDSYYLNDYNIIASTNVYGKLDTTDIPSCTVEVNVKVNDNGVEYDTILYAGAIVSSYNEETNQIKPSIDWALIDVTKQ